MAMAILVIAALTGVVDWVAAQTNIWRGGWNSCSEDARARGSAV
jgi:hypothetical protein